MHFMSHAIQAATHRFVREERGLALTEYLILLGILSTLVIAAVIVFGNNLGGQWALWAQWFAPQNFSAPTGSSG